MRHRASERRGKKSKSSPTRSPLAQAQAQAQVPSRPLRPNYTNYQPQLSPVSSDSEQETTMSRRKTLGTLREDDEREAPRQELGQHNGSLRSVLAGQGGVKNRIKAFEMTSGSESSLSSIQSEDGGNVGRKPPIALPRTRSRTKTPLQSGESPRASPSHPKVATRSKSVDFPPTASELDITPDNTPPPLPPKTFNKSPPHVHVSSPKRIPIINEELLEEPPPLGPGHPLRPDTYSSSKPLQPPRPTPSVYQRAKDRSKSSSPCLAAKAKGRATGEESEDSDTASSVHSYASKSSTATDSSGRPHSHGKPRHRVKKTRSHSHADQTFQALRPPQQPRRKSSSETEGDLYPPPLEAPPQNTMGGATGGGNPLNEEMAGTLIKYILASPDPTLKTALKNLLKNDEEVMSSLK